MNQVKLEMDHYFLEGGGGGRGWASFWGTMFFLTFKLCMIVLVGYRSWIIQSDCSIFPHGSPYTTVFHFSFFFSAVGVAGQEFF